MKVHCPVCQMEVEEGDLALVYLRMPFVFCSEQCRERFQATPHLYVGLPGQKAAKQEGRELLKRRCIQLDARLTPEEMQMLEEALKAMMGIKQLFVEEDAVQITYDLIEATEAQIERTLLEAGVRLGSGWTERMRRAWVHYTEDCEALNMQVTNRGHHHS